ncbi:MAG: hypothetical protein HYZ29_25255 [Myxococcales bacterium]|nr:hypothetical protein [Myxococcales bacterium]
MRPWTLFAALGLLGCDDPLAHPQDIDRLRVLGARVSVNGDASRASPAPGDLVSLEWLVADPDPAPAVGWAFAACPSQARSRGTPECVGPVFAQASAPAPSAALPRFDFTAADAERILVRGVVCRDGVITSLTDSCAGERESVLFELRVGDDNANPTLGDAELWLDDAPWPAPSDLGAAACAPGDLPAASGAKLDVRVVLAGSDRDPIEDPKGLAPPFEPLFVSQFSTLGHFARPLSVIEGSSEELELGVDWRAPDDAVGQRARFYFVVRDGRGGVDWSARTACLVP